MANDFRYRGGGSNHAGIPVDVFGEREAYRKMNGHLATLSKSQKSIARDYEYLDAFDPQGVYSSFLEASQDIINEAEAMTGSHITEEGRRNKIREEIEELRVTKKAEVSNLVVEYRELNAATLDRLEKQIHKNEGLSPKEVARITLRNSELLGEIKGRLYNLDDTRNLEFEFKKLVELSRHDEGLARFLSKNYYLFLDRVKELDLGEMESNRTTYVITQQADQVKKHGYSEKENAMLAVRDSLKKKTYGAAGVERNIDQQARTILNKYS